MAQSPNGNTHRPPPPECDPHKQHSNGFITPDSSRTFTKSSSDTFAPQPSTVSVPSEKNRSATCEGFPSFSDELHRPSSRDDSVSRRLKDDVEKQAIFGSDVTNEHEDWSEGSHTLGGSSDSAKTVKTEICLRPGKPDVRKTVHSWPESTDATKSSASISTSIPSPNSFESATERKKRVRMKDAESGRPKAAKDKSASSKDKTTSSKDRAASSREKPGPHYHAGDNAASSKEKSASSEAQPTSRSPGRPREKDVALKLPPATVHVPADKQVTPL